MGPSGFSTQVAWTRQLSQSGPREITDDRVSPDRDKKWDMLCKQALCEGKEVMETYIDVG